MVQRRIGPQRIELRLDLRRRLHRLVRLFQLLDRLRLEERVRQQTRANAPKARVGLRQKDAAHLHNIPRTHLPRQAAIQVHTHRPWNVAHRHLVRHFLDANFLVRQKLARPDLGVQRRSRLVCRTHAARTKRQRHVLLPRDFLEHFGTTHIARIRIHEDRWTHIRNARHDATHTQQLAEMRAANRSNRQRRRRARKWPYIQHVSPQQGRWERLCHFAHTLLVLLVQGIAFQTLVPNHVQHIVLVRDITTRVRHDAIDHVTEQIHIALGIGLDRRYERASHEARRGRELRDIVQLNHDHFLITIRYALQLYHILVHHGVRRRVFLDIHRPCLVWHRRCLCRADVREWRHLV